MPTITKQNTIMAKKKTILKVVSIYLFPTKLRIHYEFTNINKNVFSIIRKFVLDL